MKILFPIEATVAMEIPQVNGTLEFTFDSSPNPHLEIRWPTVDLNEFSFETNDAHLTRLRALSKTVQLGKRFFPCCSNVLKKIMDDESELDSIGRDTSTERKRRFHELQDLLQKAFSEDKESSSLTSLRYSSNADG